MTYAVQQDMIDRFGQEQLIQLTDRADPPVGAIDAQVLGAALADADAVINSFAGRRYSVPLSPVPAVVVLHAAAIAYYTLHRGHYPEEVRTAFDDAMAFLKQIADGTALLECAAAEAASAPNIAQSQGADRVSSRCSLRGY